MSEAAPRRIGAAEADALIDQLEAELTEPPRSTLAVLLTPKWLGALLVVLVIVAAFLGLGWWQTLRAVTPGDDGSRGTEEVRPLTGLLIAGEPINVQAIEQRTSVDGTLLPGTATVVANRTQQFSGSDDSTTSHEGSGDKLTGYWVIAGLEVTDSDAAEHTAGTADAADASDAGGAAGVLPVAVGWVPDLEQAEAGRDLVERLAAVEASGARASGGEATANETADGAAALHLSGRIMPYEGVEKQQTTAAEYLTQVVAGGELVNTWQVGDRPWYEAYVVVSDGFPAEVADHFDTIYSPPPSTESQVNWMNLFYAAEWAVFAVFALFLWWRLGRDEYEHAVEYAEQEREQLELLRRVSTGHAPVPDTDERAR